MMGPIGSFYSCMDGSYDMRYTGFRRLTVVNGTPGLWGVTFMPFFLGEACLSFGEHYFPLRISYSLLPS